MNKFLKFVAEFSTSNARIFSTIFLSVATAAKYLLTSCNIVDAQCVHWEPSVEWCGFLIAMSGLDVGHYLVKRKTSWEPTNGNGDTTNGNGDTPVEHAPPAK